MLHNTLEVKMAATAMFAVVIHFGLLWLNYRCQQCSRRMRDSKDLQEDNWLPCMTTNRGN